MGKAGQGKILGSGGGGGASATKVLLLDQTTPQHVINGKPIFDEGIDVNNENIINVADPVDITDATNKQYTDLACASIRITEFFSDVVDSGLGAGNYVMDRPQQVAGTITTANITALNQAIFNHITPTANPALDRLIAGVYQIRANLLKTLSFLGTKTVNVYCELWLADAAGVDVGTALATSTTTDLLTTSDKAYDIFITIPTEIAIATTNRLKLKWYANYISGIIGNATVTLTVGGTKDPYFLILVNSLELNTIFIDKTTAGQINGLTDKGTPVDADVILGENSAGVLFTKIKISLVNIWDKYITAKVNAAADKATLVGADKIVIYDSVGNVISTTTYTELLALLGAIYLPKSVFYNAGTGSGAVAIDFNNGRRQYYLTNGNVTTITCSNIPTDGICEFWLIYGGTHTVTGFDANSRTSNSFAIVFTSLVNFMDCFKITKLETGNLYKIDFCPKVPRT